VRLHSPGRMELPALVTRELTAAAGEALTNVRRYARVENCEIHVRDTPVGSGVTVEIVDQGIGFDPSSVAGSGRGIRDSIIRRMAEVGGLATVTSAPEKGTTVELSWSP
jgi:signal transduction histidine kinase